MAVHGGNVDEIGRQYNICTKEILDFSANINPLGISKGVKESMVKAIDKVEVYPDITYYDLKHTIVSHEGVEISNIFLGNGAAEVIFNLVRALKPKKALLPAPTFSEYEEAVRSIDGEVEYYELKEEKNFCIDDEFLNHIDESIDLIFICNPNNPTGVLTNKDFIERILEKATEFKVKVVLDESFLDFVEGNHRYSAKALIESYNNLIIVKSLTKFYAMPGIRIGYGMTFNKEVQEVVKKVSIPWAVNIVAAEGICTGLREEEYKIESIKYVEEQKNWLYEELKKLEFIKVFMPSVNFIMFKVLKNIDLKEVLISNGILIRSCENYVGLTGEFYRVAVRTAKENERLISVMKTVSFEN